jgi:hypothetical protein
VTSVVIVLATGVVQNSDVSAFERIVTRTLRGCR